MPRTRLTSMLPPLERSCSAPAASLMTMPPPPVSTRTPPEKPRASTLPPPVRISSLASAGALMRKLTPALSCHMPPPPARLYMTRTVLPSSRVWTSSLRASSSLVAWRSAVILTIPAGPASISTPPAALSTTMVGLAATLSSFWVTTLACICADAAVAPSRTARTEMVRMSSSFSMSDPERRLVSADLHN